MRRIVEAQLAAWAARSSRPLLILGARQVGKTYSVRQFGAEHFEQVAYANFQTDLTRLGRIFDGTLDPRRIVDDLSLVLGLTITPEDTLIVFDEVQLCQAALTSLKYFAEEAPQYRIIATGSQFGATVHRDPRYSFPVGKVDIVTMYPLTFEEFCWATGHDTWPNAIRGCLQDDRPLLIHDDVMRVYRQYLMCGGMPAVVSAFAQTANWSVVREMQADLVTLYAADARIYLPSTDAVRTQSIWRSAPNQLARENRKFKLADVAQGARSAQYEPGFAWLEDAGLIQRHRLVETATAPLRFREDGTFFKVYLLDVGLLSQAMGVRPDVYLDAEGRRTIASGFRGGLTENAIKQALVAQNMDSGYWTSGNTAEIDFLVVDDHLRVVPIEVKSSANVRSKSLTEYVRRFQPPLAIRLADKNFGREDILRSVPLYAGFCLRQAVSSAG
ncbi:MAG: ATP-binding protein [Propionibacteriaceae bacterium]|nr:ATP-binding protein [Propionibacteriaceae bacterium]